MRARRVGSDCAASIARVHAAHGLEQLGVPLLGDQPADHRNDGRRLVGPERLAQPRSLGVVRRRRKESRRIGAVADGEGIAGPAEAIRAGGPSILFGLREQRVGEAAAEPLER
jgi:hypothetical protein